MRLAPGQQLIAEVKPKSPFGHESDRSWEELFEIADEHGDIVAVHTDSRWDGSFELLQKARGMTNKRLLAKGIHRTDEAVEEAVAAGADLVLVVGRIPEIHKDRCLIESRSLYDLRSLATQGLKAVWNSRDLETGNYKINPLTCRPITFDDARQVRPNGWLCQASNIQSIEDVHPTANAILVGQHLPEFVETLS